MAKGEKMAEYIYRAEPIGEGEYSHTLVGELVRCEECIYGQRCGRHIITAVRGGQTFYRSVSFCSNGERRADDD